LNCASFFCKQNEYYKEIAYNEFSNIAALYEPFSQYLYRVANLSSALLDIDSNIAASFNSAVNKFRSRKRINVSLKSSYEDRCHGAVVNYNTKGLFVLNTLTKLTGGNLHKNYKRDFLSHILPYNTELLSRRRNFIT
jgi:hypothetical protein